MRVLNEKESREVAGGCFHHFKRKEQCHFKRPRRREHDCEPKCDRKKECPPPPTED